MQTTPVSAQPGAMFRLSSTGAGHLVRLCNWVGGFAVIAMMLHVCADIVLREVFGIVIPGTIEIVSYFYMVACICLAFPAMQLAGAQVVVEVFVQNASTAALRWLKLFAAVMGLAYVGVLGAAAIAGAWSATKDGEMQLVGGSDLITWPSRWINVTGLCIMAAVLLWQIWALWLRQPEEVRGDDEVDFGEPV